MNTTKTTTPAAARNLIYLAAADLVEKTMSVEMSELDDVRAAVYALEHTRTNDSKVAAQRARDACARTLYARRKMSASLVRRLERVLARVGDAIDTYDIVCRPSRRLL